MANSMKGGISWDYDCEGDVLYVFEGSPYPTTNFAVDANFTLRFNADTKEVVGLIITNFSDLFSCEKRAKDKTVLARGLFQTFRQLVHESKFKEPSIA